MLNKRSFVLALPLALCFLQGCATDHLIRWSRGESSVYTHPADNEEAVFVYATGTVLAFPVTVVWDVVTSPFQWIWGVYPYGITLDPNVDEYSFGMARVREQPAM